MKLDDLDKIARVTPLGLTPVTDAQAMAALNGRVMNMLSAKVSTLATEAAEVTREVARWEAAYSKVFAALENAWARIAYLEAQLKACHPCPMDGDTPGDDSDE